MSEKFSVTIDAELSKVWAALTDPGLMPEWMAEPEMKLDVQTSWEINSPIFIRGFHHIKFENKGIVMKYVKEQRLIYNHLSSVSKLPDEAGNYSILDFALTSAGGQTILTLDISNFPTEAIQKHLVFYWRGTIHKIKKYVEHHPD